MPKNLILLAFYYDAKFRTWFSAKKSFAQDFPLPRKCESSGICTHKVSPVFPKKLHFFLYSSPLCITIIRFQKFLVSKRYFWPKKSLKRAQKGSKSSPNFNIELRTSRTLHSSPRLKLNELEHPKKVELRTRTQVRSTTILV